jgi:hypothetical protein
MMNIIVVYLSLFAIIAIGSASRAPDVAPDLPDGWCKGGYPTRTTGECMCTGKECSGPRCLREQGFIWYSGVDCPTCKCVPKGDKSASIPSKPKPESGGSKGSSNSNSKSKPHGTIPSNKKEERAEPSNSDLSTSPALLIQEFIEDHSFIIFLILTIVSILSTVLCLGLIRREMKNEEKEVLELRQREKEEKEKESSSSGSSSGSGSSGKKDD